MPGPSYQCLTCGDTIQSKHRHDFVTCTCWKSSHDAWNNMSEEEQANSQDIITGFAIDGGSDYVRICGDIHKIRLVDGE